MNPKLPIRPENLTTNGFPAASLLAEIADLAASPVPEPVFLQELLKRAVAMLRAEAGVIWMYDAQKRLVLQSEVALQTTGFMEDPAFRAAFEQPFAEVLQSGGVMAHEADQASLRDGVRRRCLLLGGLQHDTEVSGLMQIFEARDATASDRTERLRIVEQICGLATRYWQQQMARATQQQPAAASGLADQWSLAVHDSLKPAEVAEIAANECRRLLAVDRVTVAERHGPRVKIMAVSGQQSVNPRSNVVQLLSRLTQQVLETGEKLSFTGDTKNLPPQIEKLLADYLHESRSRAVVILPVCGPAERDQQTGAVTEIETKTKPATVGALVVEQISETPLPADLDARLDRVAAHVGLALRNAQQHDRIFMLSLWDFLGSYKTLLKGRRLLQITAGVAAAAAVILAMFFLTWDYRVSGKGRLMPVDRRGIFAPWDGEVSELSVKSGQPVNAGDLLVQLKNDELQAKLLAQRNLVLEKKKLRASIAAQLNEQATVQNKATEVELSGKLLQTELEIQGADQQVESLERQVAALSVRAPITGVVATFRIEELLRKRPVKRGELLLEVMDPTGAWRLEIDVPENRLGHILQAQDKADDANPLAVRYVLATETERTYDGALEAVSTRSVVSETEGSVVPLYAALVEPVPPAPRIGAEVMAKINCGPKSLGYVLFGDVIEWVRKRFWL